VSTTIYIKIAPNGFHVLTFLVPSAPPDNVQVLVSSSTAILVTWEPIPEIDQNGIITLHEVEFNHSTFNEISTSNLTSDEEQHIPNFGQKNATSASGAL